MTTNFTNTFFSWIKENDLTYDYVGDCLNNTASTIQKWNSVGIPKGKQYACQALMDKHSGAKNQLGENMIYCEPLESERTAWTEAGLVNGQELTEFAISRINKLAETINDLDTLSEKPSKGKTA